MIPPRSNIKPPLKSQFKPLLDITLDELAHIAAPVFALSRFHDKTHRIDGIPAALQPQQIENAEWVLLCQDGAKHSPAFSYNKPLQRWDVHTRINGVSRTALQSHLNTLQQRWMKPTNTGSSASAATEYASVPTPPPAFDATSAASPTPTDVSTAAASPQGPTEQKCTLAGEPISMTRGEELLSLDDVALIGPVPFIWKRTYRTSNSRDIGLGHGWVHPGQATLTLTDSTIELIADDGRTISFARPPLGRKSHQLHEGFTLEFATPQQILISQRGQPTQVFTRVHDNLFRVTQWRHKAYIPAKQRIGVPVPASGYALDFHYDSVGRLQRMQGNWGRSLKIERDDHGRIAAIHHMNAAGAKRDTPAICYTYDADGDLIATHNAAGHGEQYRYQNHIITQRTLATGYAFYFEWDQLTPAAKCLKQWGDNGNYAYAFTWDDKNQHSTATNSLGRTTHYRYNAFGLITEETDPEGHAHQKHYNAAGQVITQINPLGHKTEFLYDSTQRLARLTNALGHTTRFTDSPDVYDETHNFYDYSEPHHHGETTCITTANGHRWQRQFNAQGLLLRSTDPLGQRTHYAYTPHGLLRQITDAAGRNTSYTWNARAEVTSQTDPLNNTLHYAYDDWGQIIEVVAQAAGQSLDHAKKSATHYDYTATGLIATVTNADKQTTAFEYNENDQLTRFTDNYGRVTQYFYDDKLRQPTKRIDPAGHVIRYQYDSERNLTALINENGEQHQFFYDGNERLIKEIGFDGRTQHYQYNAAGHLIQHLDSGAIITTFERDALGQLLTKHSRLIGDDKTTRRERSRYAYDKTGQLIETYNEHQYLHFQYDPRGLLTQETHYDLNAKKERLFATQKISAHQYNALGQRIQTTLPDGQILDYAYDASLAFQSVAWNGQKITTVQRDTLGRERTREQGALTTQTDYDPQGRLQKQIATHKENQHHVIQREYGYDTFSNLNHIQDGNDETKYVYDTLNRLTQATHATPEFFSFDPAGNLLSITDSPPGGGKPTTPGLVKGNRLLMQGDKKFEYDARGNLIKETRGKDGKLQKIFTYNLNNQLIEVRSHQRDQNVSFKYDPLGRRIEKKDAFGVTTFLWTDNLLAQETRNNIQKTYVFEPGSFKPLAQIQDDKVYHYHLDHLGTPRELTNDQGKVVWKAKYKTYGNLAVKEIEEVENNLRFQGQYYDEETGLHYNRFRYYSPDTGQFINQDPIGLLGGLNNYQYAPNPIAWIDPLGLTCKETNTPKYAITKDMLNKYEGEQYPGHPEWSLFGQDVKINYLDDAQRKVYELDVIDGKLVNSTTKEPFDTLDGGDLWSGKGKAIFVMDPQGKIYASNSYTIGEFHHSSFLSGGTVASAGTMEVAHGNILSISNDTGHYQTSQEQNKQILSELNTRGMNEEQIDKIKIENYDE